MCSLHQDPDHSQAVFENTKQERIGNNKIAKYEQSLKDYEDLLVEKNGDLIHLEFYWLLAKTTSTISIEEKHERSQVKE